MDEDRKERLARNEAAFRTVNEAIETGRSPRDDPDARVAYLCECGAIGCNMLLELTVGEYEDVRAQSRRFFVVPGHEQPEVEDVVERHDGYLIVEKHADQAGVAESTDPRR
jgi:hypothetical protein